MWKRKNAMNENFKEIFEKITDFLFNLTKKFDKISNKIKQQTGVNVNVGMIVIGIILFIFLFIVVKSILGFLWGQL